jgi:hypothetical protein
MEANPGGNRLAWGRCYYERSFLKTTRYFEEQVMRKRPYVRREWCERALRDPARRERQPDGRYRSWVFVGELGKYLRVVTLEDGETVHNAFLDRNYREVQS